MAMSVCEFQKRFPYASDEWCFSGEDPKACVKTNRQISLNPEFKEKVTYYDNGVYRYCVRQLKEDLVMMDQFDGKEHQVTRYVGENALQRVLVEILSYQEIDKEDFEEEVIY